MRYASGSKGKLFWFVILMLFTGIGLFFSTVFAQDETTEGLPGSEQLSNLGNNDLLTDLGNNDPLTDYNDELELSDALPYPSATILPGADMSYDATRDSYNTEVPGTPNSDDIFKKQSLTLDDPSITDEWEQKKKSLE